MRLFSVLALLLVACPTVGYSKEKHKSELEEVVVADELASAFYERASKSLASQLSSAVQKWCSKGASYISSGTPNAEVTNWLCTEARHSFYRNVYINGYRGAHGIVCSAKSTPRYMSQQMVDGALDFGTCVSAVLDESAYVLFFNPNLDRAVPPDPCSQPPRADNDGR